MRWFRRAIQAAKPSQGTEDDPIARGSRAQHPVKYRCHGCERWFVEPEVDLMQRDRGKRYSSVSNWLYQPLCEECATIAVKKDWERTLENHEDEWREMLK